MSERGEFVIEEVRDLDAAWPELEVLLRDSHEYYMPIVGYGPSPDWIEEVKARFQPGAEAILLLVRSTGKPVGFANAAVRTSPGEPPPRFVYIDNVYVLAESRGSGIGTAIARHLEAWARNQGVSEIRLDVFANNEVAVTFWRQFGFTERAFNLSKRITGVAS